MDLAEIFRVLYLDCLIVPYVFELKFVIVTTPQLFN